MQYRTAFSKPYWSAGLGSLQSTAKLKSTLTHWRMVEHWNSAKIMQKEGKKCRRMGKPAWPYDISSGSQRWGTESPRFEEIFARKVMLWGPGLLLALCPPLKMGSSKAAVLCLLSLPTAYTFLSIVLNWPSFKKLPITSQHCIGFSCLTWGGVISLDKGCILLSRYFCDVNETPCSG